MANLLEELNRYGLEDLIPANLCKTIDGSYVTEDTEVEEYENDYTPKTMTERFREEMEPENSEEDIDWQEYEDYDEWQEEEGLARNDTEKEIRVPSDICFPDLYSLKAAFNREMMDDDDFLDLHISDLFHVPASQLKFIDHDMIPVMHFQVFLEYIDDKKVQARFPSPEQRIKFCTFQSVQETWNMYRNVCPSSLCEELNDNGERTLAKEYATLPDKYRADINAYIDKLILHHTCRDALPLVQLYSDYLRAYGYAVYRNSKREEEGEKPILYTVTPKVSHLQDMHDKAMRDYEIVASWVAAGDKRRCDAKIAKQVESKEYQKFLYSSDGFTVIAPKDSEDFAKEGKALHHCVGSYAGMVAEGETMIFFIRRTADIEKPYYTAEIKKSGYGAGYALTQCYTDYDSIEKDPATRRFIKKWCNEKHVQVRCEI